MAQKSVRVAAKEAMQRLGYDPLESLVSYAMDSQTSSATKLEIAQTLLPYMYPKLANVTVEGEMRVTDDARQQASLMQRLLSDPKLADAAQQLSLAAAEAALDMDNFDSGMMLQ